MTEAWRELEPVAEGSRHATARLADVEVAWLSGDHAAARRSLLTALNSSVTHRFARSAGELALWARRYGVDVALPDGAIRPVQRELAGDWRGAVRAWQELDAPYEAALAALPGDERAARAALLSLYRIGAGGAVAAFRRMRAALGQGGARGPRRSTLANVAGLTRREQEVLEQLSTGATNGQIATALQLSERTVAHHVSALLGKLAVPNRVAAVERARRLDLLPQDRSAAGQT